mmetsp:Transcript_13770/g.37282  ORF Transcript_13770/g.37282 Transcript_13770/m.37282 type:complete len:228 (+) Transcript_13770:112-795(+)
MLRNAELEDAICPLLHPTARDCPGHHAKLRQIVYGHDDRHVPLHADIKIWEVGRSWIFPRDRSLEGGLCGRHPRPHSDTAVRPLPTDLLRRGATLGEHCVATAPAAAVRGSPESQVDVLLGRPVQCCRQLCVGRVGAMDVHRLAVRIHPMPQETVWWQGCEGLVELVAQLPLLQVIFVHRWLDAIGCQAYLGPGGKHRHRALLPKRMRVASGIHRKEYCARSRNVDA